ncbi:MAG: hypothetical protein R3F11_22760 [Verrucomicrobiales bacterium]
MRLGDQGDTEDLAARAVAGEVLARVCDDPMQEKVLASLTADEGYFSVEEVCCLRGERVGGVGDPGRVEAPQGQAERHGQAGAFQSEARGQGARAARRCCANAASISNGASAMCSTTESSGGPPCAGG